MKRESWIDYLKVFGMFLIIWGHFFPPHMSKYIYSINVPLFFLISGYLFKDTDSKTLFSKTIKSLAVPYIILASINLAITMALGYSQIGGYRFFGWGNFPKAMFGILTGCHTIQGIPAAGALWFVYDLIVIKFISHYASKYETVRILFLLMMSCAAIFISRLDEPTISITPLRSLPIAFVFFEFGKIFKNLPYTASSSNTIAGLLLVLCLTPLFYFSARGNGVVLLFEGYLGKSPLMFFISTIAAILILFIFFNYFKFRQNKIIYLSSIGTIVTLAVHEWLIWVIRHFFITFDKESWIYEIVSMAFSLVILVLCFFIILFTKRFLPIILGGRE